MVELLKSTATFHPERASRGQFRFDNDGSSPGGSEPRDVEAEHQAIYDAVLMRDADRAAAANLHICTTTDSVVARESDFAGIARVA